MIDLEALIIAAIFMLPIAIMGYYEAKRGNDPPM